MNQGFFMVASLLAAYCEGLIADLDTPGRAEHSHAGRATASNFRMKKQDQRGGQRSSELKMARPCDGL